MDQKEESSKFLELIDKDAKKYLFACYDYRKSLKGRQFYGSFQTICPKLKELNSDVYCVYLTINETNGPSRKKEDISRCRAIWVEDDNYQEKPRNDWPLKPSIIVQSSPGKFHYYWLTSTKKLDQWNLVMNRMVEDFGCDKNARDISRVMRIPGFKHNKELNKEIYCKLIDDNGHFYNWFEITSVFKPLTKTSVSAKKSAENISSGDYSEDKAINALLTSENYHGSLVSIAMALTNKGVSRELQYMTLFGLMNKIPPEKRRPEWEARISENHLYECIDSAIEKKESEDSEITLSGLNIREPSLTIKPSEAVFPPGRMGELCEEILEMAPYPNKEIALAGGMGLVAGIVGRAFNVLGMGLNIYIAILADSGIGKANLKDSINLALRAGGGNLNLGANFIGKSRFTGPKAIFDMLNMGLSRICILEEAGLMSESLAGDAAGITRVLLDLYTSSGYGKWAGDEGYSSRENSIPVIHSPALSVVNVSTPKSFLKALKSKSAEVSGEVARLWMLRSIGEKPYFNKKRRKDYSKEHIAVLGNLISKTYQFQQPDSELLCTEIEVPDEFVDDANKWVDLENQFLHEGDHLRRTLCSRAFAKICKMAAIVSLYNGKMVLGEDEYLWATKCVEKELSSIRESFAFETSDDLAQMAKTIIVPGIVKSLLGGYQGVKKNVPDKVAQYGIIPHYQLSQIFWNHAVLKDIDDDTNRPNPKTGLDKVITYMVKTGLLTQLDDKQMKKFDSNSKIGFRITDDFKLMMDDM